MGMLTIGAMFFFGASNWVMAQDEAQAAATQEETVAEATEEAVEATLEEGVEAATELAVESKTFHQALKEKFIQGGAGWMTPILLV
ncbi:MAG: MotA/TolQ/ExbB proton channel family protein, partial [Bacteroidales bacterium]|nr:MotA/TolQ/ExbB proton channel family protein [Bacteroidales bacterium]